METRTRRHTAAAAAAHKNSNPLISDSKFQQLYATMLRCRMLAERAGELRLSDAVDAHGGPTLSEATVAGVALDLRPEDAVAPPPGGLPDGLMVRFMKGVPLTLLLAPMPAKTGSTASGMVCAASLNIIEPPTSLADQFSGAVGAPLTQKLRQKLHKSGSITVAFSGQRPDSLAIWQEPLRFAGAHQLPVIFIVPGGLSGPSRVHQKQLSPEAQTYGFPGIPVDANDVVAVYRVAQEAILRARRGGGPTLIEAIHYTPGGHDDTPNPIEKMETYLTAKSLFTPAWKRKIAAKFRKELEAATVGAADRRPQPRPRMTAAQPSSGHEARGE